MYSNIKNILLYNSGGGLGDSLSIIPIIQWLKSEYKILNIYYIQNGVTKHFDNSLKDYDNGFVKTLSFLPEDYSFFTLKRFKNLSHLKYGKEITKSIGIKKFDIIVDTQTRVNNSLILKSIPHKYFISPCVRFFMSKPKKLIFNSKNICGRIFDYLEKVLNTKIKIPTEINNLPNKYNEAVSKLFNENKKYVGFSITSGHPTRKKELLLDTVIDVANNLSSKNLVPTFLIEEKYKKEIIEIKKKVKNAYFPESYVSKSIRNPLLVVAIGKKLNSAISIDNGIMHMLGLAGTKTAVFYENNSEKFRPMNDQNIKIYSATHPGNKKIPDLNSNDVLNFIKDFI